MTGLRWLIAGLLAALGIAMASSWPRPEIPAPPAAIRLHGQLAAGDPPQAGLLVVPLPVVELGDDEATPDPITESIDPVPDELANDTDDDDTDDGVDDDDDDDIDGDDSADTPDDD